MRVSHLSSPPGLPSVLRNHQDRVDSSAFPLPSLLLQNPLSLFPLCHLDTPCLLMLLYFHLSIFPPPETPPPPLPAPEGICHPPEAHFLGKPLVILRVGSTLISLFKRLERNFVTFFKKYIAQINYHFECFLKSIPLFRIEMKSCEHRMAQTQGSRV